MPDKCNILKISINFNIDPINVRNSEKIYLEKVLLYWSVDQYYKVQR